MRTGERCMSLCGLETGSHPREYSCARDLSGFDLKLLSRPCGSVIKIRDPESFLVLLRVPLRGVPCSFPGFAASGSGMSREVLVQTSISVRCIDHAMEELAALATRKYAPRTTAKSREDASSTSRRVDLPAWFIWSTYTTPVPHRISGT
jgi:hypothetical protein